MDVRLVSCVCCMLCRQWSLRLADQSFTGVLPGVCNCVCVLETATMRRLRLELGFWVTERKKQSYSISIRHKPLVFCSRWRVTSQILAGYLQKWWTSSGTCSHSSAAEGSGNRYTYYWKTGMMKSNIIGYILYAHGGVEGGRDGLSAPIIHFKNCWT
jgi:hypothetical protein